MQFEDKHKQALLAGGILGIVVLALLIYFGMLYVEPQTKKFIKDAGVLKTQRIAEEKDLAQYSLYLKDEVTRKAVEDAYRKISSRLPNDQDPFAIFELLRRYFEGSDVQFTFLEPGREANRGRFREFPFLVRGSARYHEFGQLVNLVECNPDRLMHVASLKLENNNKRPSIHPMTIEIVTFTFNEN